MNPEQILKQVSRMSQDWGLEYSGPSETTAVNALCSCGTGSRILSGFMTMSLIEIQEQKPLWLPCPCGQAIGLVIQDQTLYIHCGCGHTRRLHGLQSGNMLLQFIPDLGTTMILECEFCRYRVALSAVNNGHCPGWVHDREKKDSRRVPDVQGSKVLRIV